MEWEELQPDSAVLKSYVQLQKCPGVSISARLLLVITQTGTQWPMDLPGRKEEAAAMCTQGDFCPGKYSNVRQGDLPLHILSGLETLPSFRRLCQSTGGKGGFTTPPPHLHLHTGHVSKGGENSSRGSWSPGKADSCSHFISYIPLGVPVVLLLCKLVVGSTANQGCRPNASGYWEFFRNTLLW